MFVRTILTGKLFHNGHTEYACAVTPSPRPHSTHLFTDRQTTFVLQLLLEDVEILQTAVGQPAQKC